MGEERDPAARRCGRPVLRTTRLADHCDHRHHGRRRPDAGATAGADVRLCAGNGRAVDAHRCAAALRERARPARNARCSAPRRTCDRHRAGRRHHSRNLAVGDDDRLHAAGAVALVAGLVLALSFLPGATGVPLVLGRLQRIALGNGAWVIPLAGVLSGIALLRASERSRLGRRACGAALVVLVSITAYHARVPRGAEWSTGLGGGGGGAIAGALLGVLRRPFGEGGAWLVLALSAIGGALLWVNISLAAAVGGVLSTVQWTAAELVGAVLAFWQLIAGGTAAAASIVTSSVTGITHAIWRGGRAIRERVRVLRQPPPHPVPRPADAAT